MPRTSSADDAEIDVENVNVDCDEITAEDVTAGDEDEEVAATLDDEDADEVGRVPDVEDARACAGEAGRLGKSRFITCSVSQASFNVVRDVTTRKKQRKLNKGSARRKCILRRIKQTFDASRQQPTSDL